MSQVVGSITYPMHEIQEFPKNWPRKNRQYESMTRIIVDQWTVRVWFTEYELTHGPNYHVIAAVTSAPVGGIAEALDKISGVAAYEILDKDGNGAVVYPDWS